MPTDKEVGGPCAEERQLIYARMQLCSHKIHQIENMVAESGAREVASAALTNVRVRLNSVKNKKTRVVESHTCELVFAYELEIDPDVIGYYAQVPCRRVRRITKHGRTHISTAHLDFLVFRRNSVELVECKQAHWLQRQKSVPENLWEQTGDSWTYPPYADWARRHGLVFRTWVAPEPVGIYRQNLEACYAVMSDAVNQYEKAAIDKAIKLIGRAPRSIESIACEVPGFSQRMALWMLANSVAFGPWKSTSVSLADRFHLYAHEVHAQQVDQQLLRSIFIASAQPNVTDSLLTATTTDLKKARQRLTRLEHIEAGQLPATDRMNDLARQVRDAVASGRSALSACLTKYGNSGNRTPRLLPEHEEAIETVIARYWNTGRCRRPKDLFYVFEMECDRLGVAPCGRSKLDARRRKENPLRHALSTGGMRAYHAVRPSTDPRSRSLAPLGYGQVLHIDSSDLDVRCAPDLINCFPATKAKFYIGIDGATGDTMAHAIIFGPARTDGLALLMREYVRRHGFLPRTIHVDRGPENRSDWIEEFCDGRVDLRHSPTAASAWNGIVENAIKQVNDQVAHQLVGSTAPDQHGRKVDGRFKSINNARTEFVTVVELLKAFIYEDLSNTPGADGRAPVEKKNEALAAYGPLGTPCEWDDDLLIRTSIAVPQRGRFDAQRGVRTADGWFVSNELINALRSAKPDQLRSDCGRPDILWVKFGSRWIKAFHNRVQSIALLTDEEKLFELLVAPIRRAHGRRRREEIARVRHSRQRLAEVASAAIHHLAPTPIAESRAETTTAPVSVEPADADLVPYDEREDF